MCPPGTVIATTTAAPVAAPLANNNNGSLIAQVAAVAITVSMRPLVRSVGEGRRAGGRGRLYPSCRYRTQNCCRVILAYNYTVVAVWRAGGNREVGIGGTYDVSKDGTVRVGARRLATSRR